MSQNYTNRKASQALRGQATLVTLDSTDAANLYLLAEGQLCFANTAGVYGTINRVDYYGNSFSVKPIQLNREFGTYGYLAVNEIVNVRT